MFEQTFVQTGKTNTTKTVILSFVVQIAAIAVAGGAAAYLFPGVAVSDVDLADYGAAAAAASASSASAAAAPPKVVKVIPRQMDAGKLLVPKVIPKEIKQINEDEAPPSAGMGVAGGVPGGVAGGAVGGVLGGILGGIPVGRASASASACPRRNRRSRSIVTVGGRVQAAKLIRNPQPVYPQIARAGAHLGNRGTGRHHRRRRPYPVAQGRQRPPAAAAGRARRGQTVGLSAHALQ